MNNFDKDFNKNKTGQQFDSPGYKVDSNYCKLSARVKQGTNNELFLFPYLYFESNNQSNYPINVYVKFTVENHRFKKIFFHK